MRPRTRGGASLRVLSAFFSTLFAMQAISVNAAPEKTESEIGSHIRKPKPAEIPESGRLSKAEVARATVYQFANCIVASSPRKVNQYLSMKMDSEATNAALGRLATSECLRWGSLQMPPLLLRGAIFRSLYMRDFKIDPTALRAEPVDFTNNVSVVGLGPGTRYLAYMAFGDCVVRSDFSNAASLTRAEVGTKAESDAFSSIIPKLGPCLMNGMEMRFSKDALAAIIAEAVYREAESERQSNSQDN